MWGDSYFLGGAEVVNMQLIMTVFINVGSNQFLGCKKPRACHGNDIKRIGK